MYVYVFYGCGLTRHFSQSYILPVPFFFFVDVGVVARTQYFVKGCTLLVPVFIIVNPLVLFRLRQQMLQ